MKCDLCSTPIPPGSAFCPECGNKVDGGVASPTPAESHLTGKTIIQKRDNPGSSKLEPGTTFAGRYQIEKTIGAGGMGTVYLAEDSHNAETVALKLINPAMLADDTAAERLVSEGLLTRKIRHPNVVAVHDVAKADGLPYLTMEYLEGLSLRTWIANQLSAGTEIAVETAAGVINAILDGLQVAHAGGVIHRDLKPENVMLLGEPNEGDFRLKILDFGIAKALSASLLSTSTSAAGTPLYMAPEQRTSPEAVGPAADIYSLARMLYELLMDVLPDGPWQGPSEHRSDIPKGIDDLLVKGLSNRPRSRHQTVEEFRSALAAAFVEPELEQERIVETEKRKVIPPPENILDGTNGPVTDWSTAKTGGALAAAGVVGLILWAATTSSDLDSPNPSQAGMSFSAATQEPLRISWWQVTGYSDGDSFSGEITDGGPVGIVTGNFTDETHIEAMIVWPNGQTFNRVLHIDHPPSR